ncbi:MAG: hypothetical protein LBR27_02680 [Bifidobacteriaceae bacterium]|jgi:hypothetical protein|nr:hypothetical protein [Bifidobacteriaceae bacterium]
MGFFKRQNKNQGLSESPLDGFSPSDYRFLLDQVSAALQAAGSRVVQVTDDGTGVIDDQGMIYGLWNLSVRLRGTDRQGWRAAIDEFLAMRPENLDDPLSGEDLKKVALPRLTPEGEAWGEAPPWARPAAPGLNYLLAIDKPNMVVTETATDLFTRYGATDEDWRGPGGAYWEAAKANLRAFGQVQHFAEPAGDDGAVIHAFDGDDFFIASRLAILDELMRDAGVQEHGLGLYVAVPTHQTLWVLVVEGPNWMNGAQKLAAAAIRTFQGEQGALSPWLFYRPDGEEQLVQVTMPREGEQNSLDFKVPGPLRHTVPGLGS